jgi:hypothetical protein
MGMNVPKVKMNVAFTEFQKSGISAGTRNLKNPINVGGRRSSSPF